MEQRGAGRRGRRQSRGRDAALAPLSYGQRRSGSSALTKMVSYLPGVDTSIWRPPLPVLMSPHSHSLLNFSRSERFGGICA